MTTAENPGTSRVSVPLVSVLMAAYNAEDTIGAAISGVLHQTHPRVQLVVVDDGSSDRTNAICASFGDRITLVRTENHGLSHARNVARRHARGEVIAICDSDDQLLPPALEWGLRRMNQSAPRAIVTQEALLLTEAGLDHGRRLIRNTFPVDNQRMAILERNFVGIFTMFPRELLDEVGGFDETLRKLEDWELWLRAIYAGWRIVFQPRAVAVYRMAAGSLSSGRDRFAVERRVFLRFRERQAGQMTPGERAFLDARIESSPGEVADAAISSLRAGEWQDSRRLYRQLVELSPTRRDVRWKARAISKVPMVDRLLQLRQRRLDARVGGRIKKGPS